MVRYQGWIKKGLTVTIKELTNGINNNIKCRYRWRSYVLLSGGASFEVKGMRKLRAGWLRPWEGMHGPHRWCVAQGNMRIWWQCSTGNLQVCRFGTSFEIGNQEGWITKEVFQDCLGAISKCLLQTIAGYKGIRRGTCQWSLLEKFGNTILNYKLTT